MAEQQLPPDPIRTKSLSGPIAISTAILLLTTAWAIWDEGIHKRPYVDLQNEWIESLGSYLDKIEPNVSQREGEVINSPEVQAIGQRAQALNEELAPKVREVEAKLNAIAPKLEAMDFQFRDRKGMSDMLINQIENAHDPSGKEKLRKKLADYRAEKFTIAFKDGTKKEYTAPELITEYFGLKTEQGLLQAELGRLNAPVQAIEKERSDLVAKLMRGQSTATIAAMKGELTNFKKEIKQIHVPEMRDLVDRCESCHLGTRSPIPLKAEDLGGKRVFASHPNPALLAAHDPEKFGCSPCHWGNGVAVINTETAHGHYHHWLWPMPAKENMEAGCVQCHTADLTLEHAPVLNAGKETFRFRGCWGCHRYDGFEVEADKLGQVQKNLRDLTTKEAALKTREGDVKELRTSLGALTQTGDFSSLSPMLRDLATEIATKSAVIGAAQRAPLLAAMKSGKVDDDQINALLAASTDEAFAAIPQQLANVDVSRATVQRSERESLLEVKKIGPSLKEVRMKLKPEWLPTWIKDPANFRPTTKMPTYADLTDKQVDAISAFIWSRGVQGPLEKKMTGNAKNGERLVRDRGCVGCHSANIGGDVIGGTFAANLTRVGEKANFDYLVRWVADPKRKTLPYSYGLKRDLTEDDFKKANVPFEFEHQNPAWPKEWGTLLTHQMTVMPNLRLSDADSRDIATYLVDQRTEGTTYPNADAITSASKETLAYGEKLVKHYGCSGCHEIAGLEDEQKIGTELTKEGSKPIERLDFGHLTKEAKESGHEKGWYNQKGFFDRKLANPQIWDQGKEIQDETQKLRMPNFRFNNEDVTNVSTFLIGSVESGIPEAFKNFPQDHRKAIQEGWWLIKKYNCIGCHAVQPGEKPVLWATPWFEIQGKEMPQWTDSNGEVHRGGTERRPPTLVNEGARVDPQWLSVFLRNPALRKDFHGNGVRPYLNVRMPTYDLSTDEIGKLVKFFDALANQPLPYLMPDEVSLTADEAAAGRAVLTICSKCHATGGDMTKFSADVNAPAFQLAQSRLKPAWVGRLLRDPGKMLPGTNMPPWFKDQDGRWVLTEPWPDPKHPITSDQVDLMVRFLAQYNNPGIGKE